ncbi:MAG: hypothetical protein JWQ66_1831 [Mucilaginibacter sp.]|nr:hypothetical protein [Mucilaginibacter sp.]
MRKYLLVIISIILITGCSKHGSNGIGPAVPSPGKVTLNFPEQNAACTTGTIVSPTQSTIAFTWGASANTDSYKLSIKNLLTQVVTYQTTTNTKLSETLLRNTPYSYYVISRSKTSADTSVSDTWKFYNAGPGSIVYAPFPADVVFPALNQTVMATDGAINLSWKGSSVDNDIIGYDVYFGNNSTPSLYKTGIKDMFLNNIQVIAGKSYYWMIVTKDMVGNTSNSSVFKFKAN